MEALQYDVQGATAIITFNRPTKGNAFDEQMSKEFVDALHRIGTSQDIRAAVITGVGEKFFCTGHDLSEVPLTASKEELRTYFNKVLLDRYHPAIRKIMSIPKPIVAALNGTVAGVGLSIALACDRRFAWFGETIRDDKNVIIDHKCHNIVPSFAKIGLVPDGGLIILLEAFLDKEEMMNLLEPDAKLHMAAAYDMHLVSELRSAQSDVLPYALKYVEDLLSNCYWEAWGKTKYFMNMRILGRLENFWPREADAQAKFGTDPYFLEHARALLDKRAPKKGAS